MHGGGQGRAGPSSTSGVGSSVGFAAGAMLALAVACGAFLYSRSRQQRPKTSGQRSRAQQALDSCSLAPSKAASDRLPSLQGKKLVVAST